ncbi:MAG: hypothetical protein DMG87_04560 [Acidobacteria bacterium]|nr:MAG: hypothetical protein DMG87_04560 [Acidobacteriota bacterium]
MCPGVQQVTSSVREWFNLGVRWFHVFAGIMWVGQTYYFTWLDAQFSKLEKKATAGAPPASVWMVHSGGFYAVGKKQSLEVEPEQVRWFRWEALMTWLSGMVLLFLVYYFTGGLIDTDVADISQGCGIAIGLAVLAGGWLIYDLAARSLVGKSEAAFAGFALVMTAAISWGLLHALSGRAAYIHIGAIFGTIMTANVWFRILPAQRKMITAAAAGAKFDASLSAQAKLRSKHNTFMAVPVVVLMISNHFPVATYGNTYSWEILIALVLVGWAAGKLIRSF